MLKKLQLENHKYA